MASYKIHIPNLKARRYPPGPTAQYDGYVSVDMSSNSLFIVTFKEDTQAVLCDIDDVTIDDVNLVVSFEDSLPIQQFQLSHKSDSFLLRSMINTCKDIFDLSLRINTAVRDCFHSGIRCGGSMPSTIGDKHILSAVADIVHRDLPAVRTSDTPPTTTPNEITKRLPDNSSHPTLPPRKAPRKCFFCQMGAKKYREQNIIIHPYVPCDFKGADIYMCLKCVANWKRYRDAAIKGNELILSGESNEELCALCSSLPDTLVLCASCPRSFCEVCLSIVIGQTEFRKMKSQENWKCMECSARAKKKEQNICIEPKRDQITSSTEDKEKKDPGGNKKSPQPVRKKHLKRKATDDIQEAAVPSANDTVHPLSTIVPVKEKELDELYYFGQYVKVQDEVYDCFRTRPVATATNTACRGSVRNALKKAHRCLEQEAEEASEDYCLLCKDGGELMECDYVHRIWSESYINPGTARPLPKPNAGTIVEIPKLWLNKRCRKVYHSNCLGFSVDGDIKYWKCPKHYCAEGSCRNTPFYSCDLCPVSFCRSCAYKWGQRQGGKHQYVEIALVSEYYGKDLQPTAPNRERMRIICNSCIDMAEKCFDRAEVTSENLLWLLKTKKRSFDPKSNLFQNSNSTDNGPFIELPPAPVPVPVVSPRIGPSAVGTTILKENSSKSVSSTPKSSSWSDDDLEYFTSYIKAYCPRPEGSSVIGDILKDKNLRSRLSHCDEFSIRAEFYKIINQNKLKHLVKRKKV